VNGLEKVLRQRKNQGQLNHNPAESVIIDHLRLEYGKIVVYV